MSKTLKVPTKITETTLGQVIALSHIIEMSKKDDLNEVEYDSYCENLGEIFGTSRSYIHVLPKEDHDRMLKRIPEFMNMVLDSYNRVITKGWTMQSFSCIPYSEGELLGDVTTAKTPWARLKLKKKLRMKKFTIPENVISLPTKFFLTILDGVMKQIEALKPENYHHEWRFIPIILGCTAWMKGESMLKDGSVDTMRADKFSEVFLQIPAAVAFQAYNFFLLSLKYNTRLKNMSSSDRKSIIPTFKQLRVGSDYRKRLVGS